MGLFSSNKSPVTPTNTPSVDPGAELQHITQEMYKKNLELAEINKTLSLLRKIDVVVLSTVTNISQIAKQVVNMIVEDTSFRGVVIYLYNKTNTTMDPVAISENPQDSTFFQSFNSKLFSIHVSPSTIANPVVESATEKIKSSTSSLSDLLSPQISQQEAQQLQQQTRIKSVEVFPLIVRDELLGTLAIFIGEEEQMLTDHQKDLMERLAGVIGIALDNALLFKSLNDTSAQLQEANDRLKKLDELKDEFVSLASHELRTPMTVIKSYLWMLMQGKNGELNEKQKMYIDRALTSTERLINLVNDMLNVSRIESGRFTLDLKQVDINKLVEEVVIEMKPRADELGITLATEISDHPTAVIDPDRIKQVLINLIGNSLKFTPKGGKITVLSDMRGDRVVMQVSDTGIGIEKEDMPKLFHKFGMVGNNYLTKMNTQGTGLGLYLSKSIVELHHGKMLAVSEGKGKGTTFSFWLTASPLQANQVPSPVQKPQVSNQQISSPQPVIATPQKIETQSSPMGTSN